MTAETGVKWVLRFVSLTTLPAFVAVAMPESWLVFALTWVEPGCSVGLLGSYLVRCLMGVYAFLGIQALIWSTDVRRYRPLILNLCVCVLLAIPLALTVLVLAMRPAEHPRVFWVIFADLVEGLAQIVLLALLLRHVPTTWSPNSNSPPR